VVLFIGALVNAIYIQKGKKVSLALVEVTKKWMKNDTGIYIG